MKPIIIDMNDMSDSSELYESKPNAWLSYFIYFVLVILLTGFAWSYFSKIDIVVKANGIININNKNTVVSADITGKIESLNVSNGTYVKKGDILLSLNSKEIKNNIEKVKGDLEDTIKRIEILKSYDEYLSGKSDALDSQVDNPYYNEFLGRRNIISLNNQNIEEDKNNKIFQNNSELSNVNSQLSKINEQIDIIEKAISSVNNNKNYVSKSDRYYYTLVETYLSNRLILKDKYHQQISSLEEEKTNLDKKSDDINEDFKIIDSKKSDINKSIAELVDKKNIELFNLSIQQNKILEQEKNSIISNKNTLESNKKTLENQLSTLKKDNNNNVKINLETEKQVVVKELLSNNEKKKELEKKISQFDTQNDKTNIIANKDGYISFMSELKEGLYLNQGQAIFNILPDDFEKYEVEIYVENSDIGKVKENQPIKLEIPAYPSNEYGFIDSKITNISKETKVDENTGQSFYIAKSIIEKNKVNKKINLNSGMITQVKIVVDEKTVIKYILEKINLWD